MSLDSRRPIIKLKNKHGFTLIELLVVIALIGLLSSIILVAVHQTKIAARDSSRKQSLRQLQKALELFSSDNGNYPNTNGSWETEANYALVSPYINLGRKGPNAWIPNLAPKYVDNLPTAADLLNQPIGGCPQNYAGYYYSSDGTNYKVKAACLAEEYPISPSDPFYDPTGVRPSTYSIYTDGAAQW